MEFKKVQNSCLSLGEWAQAGPGLAAELSYNSINSPGGPARHGPSSSDLVSQSPVNNTSHIQTHFIHQIRKHTITDSSHTACELQVFVPLFPREQRTLKAPVCGLGPACEAWLARSRSGMERCQWHWHAQSVNTVIRIQWDQPGDQMVSVANKVEKVFTV